MDGQPIFCKSFDEKIQRHGNERGPEYGGDPLFPECGVLGPGVRNIPWSNRVWSRAILNLPSNLVPDLIISQEQPHRKRQYLSRNREAPTDSRLMGAALTMYRGRPAVTEKNTERDAGVNYRRHTLVR